MRDLVEKLNAALDEEERIALAAHADEPRWEARNADGGFHMEDPWVGYKDDLGTVATGMREETAVHMAFQDPKRALRRVAAHRKILEIHRIEERWTLRMSGERKLDGRGCVICDRTGDGLIYMPEQACATLLALAEEYELTDDSA